MAWQRFVFNWSAGASYSQSLAVTLDDVTVAATQTAQHPQSLSATLDGVTVAASQVANHPQSLSATLDGVTVAVSQVASHPQAISATLDGVTVAASQAAQHPQSLAVTLDGVDVAISQAKAAATYDQTLAAVLDGIAATVSQGLQHAQALAATLDDVGFDGAQDVQGAEPAIPDNPNWTRYIAHGRTRKKRTQQGEQEQEFNEIPKQVEAKPLPVKTMADISALFTRQAIKANTPTVQAVPGRPKVETAQYNDEEDIELLLLSL